VTVSGPLAAIPLTIPLTLPSKTHTALPPARFLVGVDGSGAVRHVMSQSSSAVENIDSRESDRLLLETRQNLAQLKFAPTEATITWGFITIAWGDDVIIRDPEVSGKASR
jgi:hypothetical protein